MTPWYQEGQFVTSGYGTDYVGDARRPPPPGGGGFRPGGPGDPRLNQPGPGSAIQRQGRPPPGYTGPMGPGMGPTGPQGPYSLSHPNFMPAGMDERGVRMVVREEIQHFAESLPTWVQGADMVPGGPVDAQLMSPLGIGAGTLSSVALVLLLTAKPQRPFRGERLVVDIRRSAGAVNVNVRITDFKIGENSQLVGSNALPADTFSPLAEGVRLALTPATPGVDIVLRFETTAVPVGETVDVSAAIIGRAQWGASAPW